ncbi:MAG: YIP1 family protein [Bacteroidetes bacterium]|nr:YIP1 family protein [Bacteroidota bacterium]
MTDDTMANEPQPEGMGMSSVPPPPVEPLSITDKFIGILTEPSPTYENVRAAGARTSDWLVPVLITALILGVGMFLRFGNPTFMNTLAEKQTEELAKQVDSGRMTQEQADQQAQQFESMKGFIKISGTIGAAIGFIVVFFVLALLYWLAVRFGLKGDATFALILSAAGLSTYLSGIDQLVSLLLTFVTDKPFANLSPALFFDADIASMSTRFLMMLNPIAIWSYYVLGVGFEKVANISRVKGLAAAFAIWILFSLLGALAGFGM